MNNKQIKIKIKIIKKEEKWSPSPIVRSDYWKQIYKGKRES